MRDRVCALHARKLAGRGTQTHINAMMIEPTSLPEQLMYVTVRTAALDGRGVPISVGTGFFYNFRVSDEKSIPTLIQISM